MVALAWSKSRKHYPNIEYVWNPVRLEKQTITHATKKACEIVSAGYAAVIIEPSGKCTYVGY
jgi:hypothetical protein